MPVLFVQNTDLIALAGDAFQFNFDQEKLIVSANVLIESAQANGVESTRVDSILINHGYIFGDVNNGVRFTGNNISITNGAGALIFGHSDGIIVAGSGPEIVNNAGTVIGSIVAGIDAFGDLRLTNHGNVLGGVAVSGTAGGSISNDGLIKGAEAIFIVTSSAPATVITNGPTGVISGPDAIVIKTGMVSLTNGGSIVGDFADLANLRDVIVNHGVMQGQIRLGGGNDSFNGSGGRSGPVFGEGGNDHLIGGATADRLHGGDGNDTLTGQLGADRFFFDTPLNPATNVDTITDFTPAQGDRIVLSEAVFPGLGPLGTLAAAAFHVGAATTAGQHIIYTPGNGFLSYDANGSGAGGMTHFATLATRPMLDHTDFIVTA